ncbi:MAG: glycosidase [Ignavibacteria bacterium]|jgi:predicted GH43/DUF377 family glycosyl hydrolase
MTIYQNHYRNNELFKRYEDNPILTPSMWPYKVNTVFNAGATLYQGKVLLLVRVEDMRGFSHFSRAVSEDGLTNWVIDSKPTMEPDLENHPEDHYGIEDPRIIKMEDVNIYAIVYTSFSKSGPLVSIATTEDFVRFKRLGIIMSPEDKDASIFPKLFNGLWALLHRPTPSHREMGAHIWISFSPDLTYWGNNNILIPARKGSWWDAHRIGLGPPPIETSEGWLIIYHGVRDTAAGSLYRLGLALLDLEDPNIVIRRCDEWVFGPKELYERIGDVPDVTFPCGVIVRGDDLIMYYGAADTTICVAIASLNEVLDFILNG